MSALYDNFSKECNQSCRRLYVAFFFAEEQAYIVMCSFFFNSCLKLYA